MATITLPNTFTDGTAPTADQVAQNIYDANADSFEVINGRLDEANLTGSPSWDRAQAGMFHAGGTVGGSLNLDYFEEAFGDWSTANDDPALYTAIPGACKRFHVPVDGGLALITWQVFVANNGGSGTKPYLRTYLDGSLVGRISLPPGAPGGSHDGPSWDRFWCGHYLATSITRGYHQFEVRIASDAPITRVRCRGVTVVWFY